MCSHSSLREHLQTVRCCHSTLKAGTGKYYYMFKTIILLSKELIPSALVAAAVLSFDNALRLSQDQVQFMAPL